MVASSAQASPLSSGTARTSGAGTECTRGNSGRHRRAHGSTRGGSAHRGALPEPSLPAASYVRLPVPRCTGRRRALCAHSAFSRRFVQSLRLRCSRRRPRRRVPPSGRPSAFSRPPPQRSTRRLRHEWPRWLGCGTGPVMAAGPTLGVQPASRSHVAVAACHGQPRTRRVSAWSLGCAALVLHGWRVASCADAAAPMRASVQRQSMLRCAVVRSVCAVVRSVYGCVQPTARSRSRSCAV